MSLEKFWWKINFIKIKKNQIKVHLWALFILLERKGSQRNEGSNHKSFHPSPQSWSKLIYPDLLFGRTWILPWHVSAFMGTGTLLSNRPLSQPAQGPGFDPSHHKQGVDDALVFRKTYGGWVREDGLVREGLSLQTWRHEFVPPNPY